MKLPDASSKYGAQMGRGWDFAGQPDAARLTVRMYAGSPPRTDVERRHLVVALAFLAGPIPANKPKVRLQRIRLDSGGYDNGGAYWGVGAPLYWAASDNGSVDMWFRASDRHAAKGIIRTKHSGAVFYR